MSLALYGQGIAERRAAERGDPAVLAIRAAVRTFVHHLAAKHGTLCRLELHRDAKALSAIALVYDFIYLRFWALL